MKFLAVAIFVAVEVILVSSQFTATGSTGVTTGLTTVIETVTTQATSAMTTQAVTTQGTTSGPTTPGQTVWEVTDASGNACVLAKMDAAIEVSYEKMDNSTGLAKLLLPENAVVNATASECGNATETAAVLVLQWENNFFRQEFELNDDSYSLKMVVAELYHDSTKFPDSSEAGKTVAYNGTPPAKFFETTMDKSYKCNSMQSFDLGSNGNITYTNVKVQPFGVNGSAFSDEFECAADSSSTPEPMTTAKPPPPPAGNWTVKDADGKICMNMTLRAKFSIKYWNKENKAVTFTGNLPDDASADQSTCNDTVANFVLTFFDNWEMMMLFELSDDSDLSDISDDKGDYSLNSYSLKYYFDSHFTNPVNPGAMEMVTTTKTDIEASVGRYYKCDSTSKLKAGNTTTELSAMKLQPFALATNGTKGDDYNECLADSEISNIVPIAVGCALAGLVIIVLIAYLIGRSRSNRQGYQSV